MTDGYSLTGATVAENRNKVAFLNTLLPLLNRANTNSQRGYVPNAIRNGNVVPNAEAFVRSITESYGKWKALYDPVRSRYSIALTATIQATVYGSSEYGGKRGGILIQKENLLLSEQEAMHSYLANA